MSERTAVRERLVSRVFVGRERELAELRAGLSSAASAEGRLFLLVGEPGIGKTRLADELSAHAAAGGALVLWGRCLEGGTAPAYFPWMQVIRGYVRATDEATAKVHMGDGAAYIAQVVPELRGMLADLPAVPPPSSLDPEPARFNLFDAVTTFLKAAAGARPLVLVLDDLHAADRASLLMLRFFARELRDARVLVVGTYRDLEVRRRPELAEVLNPIARDGYRIPLLGLDEAEVARIAQEGFGMAPTAALVAALHRATEGNPFFVDEVLRLFASESGRTAGNGGARNGFKIPDGVREAIRRRLAPLRQEAVTLLRVAAAIGREFELAGLQEAAGVPMADVLEVLGAARVVGIVSELPGSLSRYAFSHALIRDTLYEDLSPAERVQLHCRIGNALERLYGADPEPYLAELAHHFCVAAPGGDAAKAIDYSTRAARRAFTLLAYEEAAVHYLHAIETLALDRPDEVRRCELLLDLGDAQDRAGETEEANATFERAAHIARELGHPELLARAALGVGGQWALKFTSTVLDKSRVPLLEEALGALPEGDCVLRAMLLARLALKLRFSGALERGEELSRAAVDMARRLGDTETLAYTLIARHAVLLGPDHLEARVVVADEMVRLGEATGSQELALRGHALRAFNFHELGDMVAVDRELEAQARLAEAIRDPFDQWLHVVCCAMRAIMEGRFAEGERLAREARDTALQVPGLQAADDNAGICLSAQMFLIGRDQGRLRELEANIREYGQRYPAMHVWRSVLGSVHVGLGRESEARAEFEELAAEDFAVVPRDTVWLAAMCLAAEICVWLGDAPRAATLYRLLLPYAGLNVALGSAGCMGAATRYLGLLAAATGRLDEAVDHFEVAVAMNVRMGAHPWVARTRYDLARVLLARDRAGDRARAGALLDEAFVTAGSLGMGPLAADAAALRSGMAAAVGSAGDRASDEVPPPVVGGGAERFLFRREGEYWTVAYGDTVSRLKHTKGLAHLAQLLRHPGEEFHAGDLIAAEQGADTSSALRSMTDPQVERLGLRVSRLGDNGQCLDPQAKAAYRRRLEDLREEAEEAEQFHDTGRLARAQEEMRFLVRELARGVGLGGRGRRSGSATERARLNVTRAIKVAEQRIAENNPSLGRHLARTVRTGTFCAYMPDPSATVSWTF